MDAPARPDAVAEWFLGWSAAAVPIVTVLAVDPAGWFPFSTVKWPAVVVATLLALAAAIITGHVRSTSTSSRIVGAALATLVGLTLLSAITALDGIIAWIGTPVRHLGALAWLVFGGAFVVGRAAGSESARAQVLRGVVIAGLCLGAWITVEVVAGNPIELAAETSRLVGPFGSAAYLGAASCLLGPIAVGVATNPSAGRLWRPIGAMSAAGAFVALIGSGSRAALLGTAVSGVVVAIVRRRRDLSVAGAGEVVDVAARDDTDTSAADVSGHRRRIVAVAAVIGVGAASVAWRAGVFERTHGLASRLDEWRIALRAIADRPLLGAGPEGYRLVVGAHLDDAYVREYGEAVGVDRAHSGVLDVAAASGALAALAYVVLVVAIVWCAVRLIRSGTTADAGTAAAVIAYVVQQQLLFPIAELDVLLWMLVGIVVTRADGGDDRRPPRSEGSASRRVAAGVVRGVGRRRVAAGVVVAVALAVAAVGVRAAAADRLAREAVGAADARVAVDRASRATRLASRDLRLLVLEARAHESLQSLRGVDEALDAVAAATEVSPLDPAVGYERARLLSMRAAITGDAGDRVAASVAWEERLAATPRCIRCLRGAADAARERGDASAADRFLEAAARLETDPTD